MALIIQIAFSKIMSNMSITVFNLLPNTCSNLTPKKYPSKKNKKKHPDIFSKKNGMILHSFPRHQSHRRPFECHPLPSHDFLAVLGGKADSCCVSKRGDCRPIDQFLLTLQLRMFICIIVKGSLLISWGDHC